MPNLFDRERLQTLAQDLAPLYREASPYPHVVIDGFLQAASARELADRFPQPVDDIGWLHYGAENFEVKMSSSSDELFPAVLRRAIHEMNSGVFVRFLEQLTGIDHLLPDPHLVGGGLHLTRKDGHLGIHADFNWHEGLQAHRRINVLLYLTPDWVPAWQGELELWDRDARRCRKSVEPLFNRAVVFNTTSDSFHGHPSHWEGTANRQSIALYYYTTSRPDDEVERPHNTRYKGYHVP
jgi:hypothetical protein